MGGAARILNHNMSMSGFAVRLTAMMDARGMNRRDLERATGIKYHRLNPWFFRENALPNGKDLKALCDYFDVSAAYLLEGTGPAPDRRAELFARIDLLNEEGIADLEKYVDFILSKEHSE